MNIIENLCEIFSSMPQPAKVATIAIIAVLIFAGKSTKDGKGGSGGGSSSGGSSGGSTGGTT